MTTATKSKKASSPARKSEKKTAVNRQQLIAEAAYYYAENRGFAPGDVLQDWLQAENDINKQLGG